MKPIILAQTEDTPKVAFDNEKGSFEISGRSMPEDTAKFYLPLLEWLTEYGRAPKEVSHFIFHFEFMSTSTTKQMMKLFFAIEQISKAQKVDVLWLYDKGDINMRRSGELLQKLVTFKLNYKDV
jgi:hypothetical protein